MHHTLCRRRGRHLLVAHFFFFLFPSAFQNLCQELEAKFYEGTFNWESVKQHDAASLLKLFIRELPQPLLSGEYLKAFQAVQSECWPPQEQSCVAATRVRRFNDKQDQICLGRRGDSLVSTGAQMPHCRFPL